MQVDRLVIQNVEQFLKGLHNKDESDESGKRLLSKAGDVAHQCTKVKCHHDQQDHSYPYADPEPEGQVVPALVTATIKSYSVPPCVNFPK